MITRVSGIFVRVEFESEVHKTLLKNQAARPARRFNRQGENALYLSPDEHSAKVAMGEYVREGDPPRVLVQYEVEECALVDMRSPEAAHIYDLAKQPWQPPFNRGEAPSSWQAADQLKAEGYVGLIDPSRRQPGLWHITLFNWNEAGVPSVKRIGVPSKVMVK